MAPAWCFHALVMFFQGGGRVCWEFDSDAGDWSLLQLTFASLFNIATTCLSPYSYLNPSLFSVARIFPPTSTKPCTVDLKNADMG